MALGLLGAAVFASGAFLGAYTLYVELSLPLSPGIGSGFVGLSTGLASILEGVGLVLAAAGWALHSSQRRVTTPDGPKGDTATRSRPGLAVVLIGVAIAASGFLALSVAPLASYLGNPPIPFTTAVLLSVFFGVALGVGGFLIAVGWWLTLKQRPA